MSQVLGGPRGKSEGKGERSGRTLNSIIHQSTYVGDTTEGGAEKEVERNMVDDERGFTWMRRDLGDGCWYYVSYVLVGISVGGGGLNLHRFLLLADVIL